MQRVLRERDLEPCDRRLCSCCPGRAAGGAGRGRTPISAPGWSESVESPRLRGESARSLSGLGRRAVRRAQHSAPTTPPTTGSPRWAAPWGSNRDRTVDPLCGHGGRRRSSAWALRRRRAGSGPKSTRSIRCRMLRSAHAFVGYMLQIYVGTGMPISAWRMRSVIAPTLPMCGCRDGQNLIRDDLDVPVMIVNTDARGDLDELAGEPAGHRAVPYLGGSQP